MYNIDNSMRCLFFAVAIVVVKSLPNPSSSVEDPATAASEPKSTESGAIVSTRKENPVIEVHGFLEVLDVQNLPDEKPDWLYSTGVLAAKKATPQTVRHAMDLKRTKTLPPAKSRRAIQDNKGFARGKTTEVTLKEKTEVKTKIVEILEKSKASIPSSERERTEPVADAVLKLPLKVDQEESICGGGQLPQAGQVTDVPAKDQNEKLSISEEGKLPKSGAADKASIPKVEGEAKQALPKAKAKADTAITKFDAKQSVTELKPKGKGPPPSTKGIEGTAPTAEKAQGKESLGRTDSKGLVAEVISKEDSEAKTKIAKLPAKPKAGVANSERERTEGELPKRGAAEETTTKGNAKASIPKIEGHAKQPLSKAKADTAITKLDAKQSFTELKPKSKGPPPSTKGIEETAPTAEKAQGKESFGRTDSKGLVAEVISKEDSEAKTKIAKLPAKPKAGVANSERERTEGELPKRGAAEETTTKGNAKAFMPKIEGHAKQPLSKAKADTAITKLDAKQSFTELKPKGKGPTKGIGGTAPTAEKAQGKESFGRTDSKGLITEEKVDTEAKTKTAKVSAKAKAGVAYEATAKGNAKASIQKIGHAKQPFSKENTAITKIDAPPTTKDIEETAPTAEKAQGKESFGRTDSKGLITEEKVDTEAKTKTAKVSAKPKAGVARSEGKAKETSVKLESKKLLTAASAKGEERLPKRIKPDSESKPKGQGKEKTGKSAPAAKQIELALEGPEDSETLDEAAAGRPMEKQQKSDTKANPAEAKSTTKGGTKGVTSQKKVGNSEIAAAADVNVEIPKKEVLKSSATASTKGKASAKSKALESLPKSKDMDLSAKAKGSGIEQTFVGTGQPNDLGVQPSMTNANGSDRLLFPRKSMSTPYAVLNLLPELRKTGTQVLGGNVPLQGAIKRKSKGGGWSGSMELRRVSQLVNTKRNPNQLKTKQLVSMSTKSGPFQMKKIQHGTETPNGMEASQPLFTANALDVAIAKEQARGSLSVGDIELLPYKEAILVSLTNVLSATSLPPFFDCKPSSANASTRGEYDHNISIPPMPPKNLLKMICCSVEQ